MAEYIDKQIILDKCQRLIDVERKQGSDVMNYGRERVNQTEVIMEYIEYMTPTADVIERSEYEKLRLVNLDLAETNKGLLAEHEQLEKLRSKIDKAIKEIEQKAKESDNNNCFKSFVIGSIYRDCIKVIKRNVGE